MKPVALLLPIALSGCIVAEVADTAVDVAKIPVGIASAGVDAVTTSQSEADEKRGRDMRKRAERCRSGNSRPGDLCPPAGN